MEQENKTYRYRVIDNSLPNYGKKIKVKEFGKEFIDVKTNVVYLRSQLKEIPKRHAVYMGIHIGHYGLFLFGREYMKYKTIQFGIGIDYICETDKMLDIELKILFFGIGIRFIKIRNLE